MSEDFEDLLGGEPEPTERPRTPLNQRPPRGVKLVDSEIDDDKQVRFDTPLDSEFIRPVPAAFIAGVFGKQTKQIAKRLARCPIVARKRWGGREVPMYDFVTAMSYLVEPKGNIDEWFAQQNQASLPPIVSKAYWDSAHQRNRVMRSANDLWHTEDVMVIMGRVALMIKEESRQWIEDMPGKDQLNDDQYNALVESVNELQDRIRERMQELSGETRSMSHSIVDELTDSGTVPEGSLGS